MVASARSPSPTTPTTVPKPNVSCDTRSPISRTIVVELLRPVARGAGVNADGLESDEYRVLEPPIDGACSFHSITPSGISERKREAGLYAGAPHEVRYSERDR